MPSSSSNLLTQAASQAPDIFINSSKGTSDVKVRRMLGVFNGSEIGRGSLAIDGGGRRVIWLGDGGTLVGCRRGSGGMHMVEIDAMEEQ